MTEVTINEPDVELDDDEQFLADHPIGSYVEFLFWDGPEDREVQRWGDGKVVAHSVRTHTGRSWEAKHGVWDLWYPDTSFLIVSDDGRRFHTVTPKDIYEP
jgi:hypothetical protein